MIRSISYSRLRAIWPAARPARELASYLAYAVSFLYIGVLWLNHHSLFAKLRRVDLGFRWINLGILFTTAILPFPAHRRGVGHRPHRDGGYGRVLEYT
jgi:uncharacterized membrane protein